MTPSNSRDHRCRIFCYSRKKIQQQQEMWIIMNGHFVWADILFAITKNLSGN
jgi:hypothetical protein